MLSIHSYARAHWPPTRLQVCAAVLAVAALALWFFNRHRPGGEGSSHQTSLPISGPPNTSVPPSQSLVGRVSQEPPKKPPETPPPAATPACVTKSSSQGADSLTTQEKGTFRPVKFNGHVTSFYFEEGIDIKTFLECYFGIQNLDVLVVGQAIHIKNPPHPEQHGQVTESLSMDGLHELFTGKDEGYIIKMSWISIDRLVASYNHKAKHETVGFIHHVYYCLILEKKKLSAKPGTERLVQKIDQLAEQVHKEWRRRIHQTLQRTPLQLDYLNNRVANTGIRPIPDNPVWTQIKVANPTYANSQKFHISLCRGHRAEDGTFHSDEEYMVRAHGIITDIVHKEKYQSVITVFKSQKIEQIRDLIPKVDEEGFIDQKQTNANLFGKEFVIYGYNLSSETQPLWIELLREIENALSDAGIRSGPPSLADRPLHGSRFISTRTDKNLLEIYLGASLLTDLGMTTIEASQIGERPSRDETLFTISQNPVVPFVKQIDPDQAHLSSPVICSEDEVNPFYQNLRHSLMEPIRITSYISFPRSSLFALLIGDKTDYLHNVADVARFAPTIYDLQPQIDKIKSKDIQLDENYLAIPLRKAARILAMIAKNGNLSLQSTGKIAPAIYYGFLRQLADGEIDLSDPFKHDVTKDRDFVVYLVECALRTREVQACYAKARHQISLSTDQIQEIAKELYGALENRRIDSGK